MKQTNGMRFQAFIRLAWMFILANMFLGLPAYGQYEGWENFYTNVSGDRFYYDPHSISFGSGSSGAGSVITQVRFKVLSGKEGSPIREVTQLVEINCSRRMYRKLESQISRYDGTLQSEQHRGDWMEVMPESSTESLCDAVCNKPKGRRIR